MFASSFGAEDMVVIDLIARHALPIRIFTLDTGRLPEETHALIDRTRERYGLPIDVYTPDTRRLQAFVRENGVNAFYASVELRQACCAVRKTEPLQRALVAKGAWITGLRRAQSVDAQRRSRSRSSTRVHALPKFNPLADWSDDDVWQYLRAHGVPYNALHDRGYPSIGCAPCTRAVAAGRGRARRPLVVGSAGAQGVRAASSTGRCRARRQGDDVTSAVLRIVRPRGQPREPAAPSPRSLGDRRRQARPLNRLLRARYNVRGGLPVRPRRCDAASPVLSPAPRRPA